MTRRHVGTCVVPSAPQNVAKGRRWLRARLESLLGAEHSACETSVLLLSEALTNAIVHGDGDTVELGTYVDDGAIRVEIIDGGGDTLPRYVDDPCGEGGRGLPIMRMLAREWGYEVLDDGRLQVWFEVPHGGEAQPVHEHDGSRADEARIVPAQARWDGTRTQPPALTDSAAHRGDPSEP
jgi:anti-sigma regulatory factor (Ser/Thr protein kinase)